MNPEEDQLSRHLHARPEDWQARLALLERLAARGAGDAVVAWIAHAPNAPATENEMRRVVELANGIGHELDALKHVLGLFLREHITSSWAHYTLAQALYFTHDTAGALQHYQTSKSLNPSRSIPELDELLGGKSRAASAKADPVDTDAFPDAFEPAPLDPAANPAQAAAEPAEPSEPAASTDRPAQKPEDQAPAAPAEAAGERTEAAPGEGAPAVSLPVTISEFDTELIRAAEKEDSTRQKISAFSVAIVFHVLLCLYFAFFFAFGMRPGVPTFLARLPEKISDPANRPDAKKIEPSKLADEIEFKQVSMAMNAPDPHHKPVNPFDPISSGDVFGSGMSFSPDAAGKAVTFFGTRARADRVVFVVDFSTSMYGDKDALMRNELKKSLIGLPKEVEYALIFFAGPAWFAGQMPPVDSTQLADGFGMAIQDGGKTYTWYEGWSEQERHSGERRTALFHYSGGESKLPQGKYLKASEDNIRKSLEQVRTTPLVFGTDWRWPLKMAMSMDPDTIYFMTDGSFRVGRGATNEQMIDELLAFNLQHGRARINTVCMKVLMARKELEQLANRTGGKFTLVRDDGSIVSGAALNKGL